MLGRVKMWNRDDGYGFLALKHPREDLKDVFVHATELQGEEFLMKGWQCSFVLDENVRDYKKIVAKNVRVVDKSPLISVPLAALYAVIDAVSDMEDLESSELRSLQELRDCIENPPQVHNDDNGSAHAEAGS